MKILIILITIFIQVGFCSNTPQWFFNLKPEQNQIIGYGTSTKLEDAKKNAKNEVATSIHSKIDSYMNMERSTQGDKITKKFKKSITVTTNIDLENLQIIKSDFINNKWFIAAAYDLSSFSLQMKKKLENLELKNEKQNKYLTNTTLIKELNDIIGKTLDYNIYVKDDIWWIAYKNQALKIPQKRYAELFTFIDSENLKIKANKTVYKSNEDIRFKIQSKTKGYVSLFYLNEFGNVGKIFQNKAIEDQLIYPTQSRLTVKSIDKKYRKFLLAAVFTKDKVNFNKILEVQENRLQNVNFPHLLDIFEKYDFTTVVYSVVK